MTARLPFSTRIGLALILIGIVWFGGWAYWTATRIWVPVDLPISLSRGHIRTPAFEINKESAYQIEIEVKREFDIESVPCPIGDHECEGKPCHAQGVMDFIKRRGDSSN